MAFLGLVADALKSRFDGVHQRQRFPQRGVIDAWPGGHVERTLDLLPDRSASIASAFASPITTSGFDLMLSVRVSRWTENSSLRWSRNLGRFKTAEALIAAG